MLKLRPYQGDLQKQIEDALANDPKARVMVQLPTGGGKTIIAGALLTSWLTGGRKAVWLTHRKELAEQTCRMLTDAHVPAMTDVKWTPGTDAPAMSQGAVILMAQTVGRRTAKRQVWNRYGADDLMVIDEAHHAAAEGWERAMLQWPGRILGMTATPWRMSRKEGFDHLFGTLLCGPQVADLQSGNWLSDARTMLPHPEQRIVGGEVDRLSGEFTETGIKLANQDRPNVMTAGVLEFWQMHAGDRPTIAYAVSVDHANNLRDMFNEASIPAGVILGDTSGEERNKAITAFRDGTIQVLVNVIVATEGFDLPDASCIAITRPTLSLALYLQMVGRGLRPKDEAGNCLILDLAANSVIHGLPEDIRKWSLKPRGEHDPGDAPVVWCPECGTVSHAASHHCRNCGYSFGKECGRCGKWRAWGRWRFEHHCGDAHQLVCDLCHIDAHIQAHLPVTEALDELIGHFSQEDEMNDYPELNDELADRLASLLKKLLEQERRRVTGTSDDRQLELLERIEERERELNDDDALDALFERHIASLQEIQSPKNRVQERRMFNEWEGNLKSELADWKNEFKNLQSQPIDKQAIVDSARNKVLHLLRREARIAGVLTEEDNAGIGPNNTQAAKFISDGNGVHDGSIDAWCPLTALNGYPISKRKPSGLKLPDGQAVSKKKWADILSSVAEWLVQKGLITYGLCPIHIGKGKRPLIHTKRITSKNGGKLNQRELSNGLFICVNFNAPDSVKKAVNLLEHFSEDPSRFSLRLES